MYAAYPVYMPSRLYAIQNGEHDLWRQSNSINQECRDFIKENASKAYHGKTLPGFMKELTDIYGLERAMFVAGRTIAGADWDGRYDKEVKGRTAQIDYQDMEEGKALYEAGQDSYRIADKTMRLISDTHPCILNDVFRSLMKMEQAQINIPQADSSLENELGEGAER